MYTLFVKKRDPAVRRINLGFSAIKDFRGFIEKC